MADSPTLAAQVAATPRATARTPAERERHTANARRLLTIVAIFLCAGAAFLAWQWFKPNALPPGIASSNGRIEATEIDIAAKIAGRIKEILVDEGDFVRAGQVLARMDTAVLVAQRKEAEAQQERALIGIDVAESQVKQREAERAAKLALVAQREAELDGDQKRLARSRELTARQIASEQRLDDDRAKFEATRAAVSAANSDVAAAEAALGTAKAEVVRARSDIEATRATVERIQADIDDSTLRSPRDGRVQYRVAQPGEVLSAGGRVLNLVDLGDVYMTFFLPTEQAGRVALGADVHVVLDAVPQYVAPARATFVADVAQFTPKTVETAEEREKLMFRIKARIDPDLLQKHISRVKTGVPGVAYVRLDPTVDWPPELQVRVPQ